MEYCANCECSKDAWSEPNSQLYCDNCEHCGDNALNCNEICEKGNISKGISCRNGKLYEQIDICYNCDYYDDDIDSDILIEECYCDCPGAPETNCVNGDYIAYPNDYYAGCSNDKCNECKCDDIYLKDVNDDKVDDKCGIEFCGNKLDDNDNGIIDEIDCIWYYCSDCGKGLFSICKSSRCTKFQQGCFFEEIGFGYGSCDPCSLLAMCEDYGYNSYNCIDDPCDINGCIWNDDTCCTDADADRICDYSDNCLDIPNPLQEDDDGDGKGNLCEICEKEPKLLYPISKNESICNNDIDDDCDHLVDCEDSDCFILCISNNITSTNNSDNMDNTRDIDDIKNINDTKEAFNESEHIQ